MSTRRMPLVAATIAATAICLPHVATGQTAETPNLNHQHHAHSHNPQHATERPTSERFFTTRSSDVVLPLPGEEDAFVFAVFGDRTGGPPEGVNVLADAVRDVNLVEPDLVMTVGDLINGYNRTPQWLAQMREFQEIMSELLCPWFPVAGNHDVYWRPTGDPNMPRGQHDEHYEMHFGPLWYSFQHKDSNFIVLYSDEGNPRDHRRASARKRRACRTKARSLRPSAPHRRGTAASVAGGHPRESDQPAGRVHAHSAQQR